MWVRAPCYGRFRCQGVEVQCGMQRPMEKHGRAHNCTCFDYELSVHGADGSAAASVGGVPEALTPSRLHEGSIHEPRFVPNTHDEKLHAVFTFWNMLDAFMIEHSKSNYQTGYIREVQLRRMMQLAQSSTASTYCEVGMNGGHSAAAMLHANPRLAVHSFDLMHWNYSWPVAHLLRTSFRGRFHLHPGDSRSTVPEFAALALGGGVRGAAGDPLT